MRHASGLSAHSLARREGEGWRGGGCAGTPLVEVVYRREYVLWRSSVYDEGGRESEGLEGKGGRGVEEEGSREGGASQLVLEQICFFNRA